MYYVPPLLIESQWVDNNTEKRPHRDGYRPHVRDSFNRWTHHLPSLSVTAPLTPHQVIVMIPRSVLLAPLMVYRLFVAMPTHTDYCYLRKKLLFMACKACFPGLDRL